MPFRFHQHRRRPISACNQPGTPTPQPAQPGVRRAMLQPERPQLAGELTPQWAGNPSQPNRAGQDKTCRSQTARSHLGPNPTGRTSMCMDPLGPSPIGSNLRVGHPTTSGCLRPRRYQNQHRACSKILGLTRDNGIRSSRCSTGGVGRSRSRIVRRRGEEERGDTFFVPERRRSRRLLGRDPRGASLASGTISTGSGWIARRRNFIQYQETT
jgi:hypothetical protein